MRDEEPTEITSDGLNKFFTKIMNEESIFHICNWCESSYLVREVGPNYICPDCEKKEKESGRPLVFISPVRDAYFDLGEKSKTIEK